MVLRYSGFARSSGLAVLAAATFARAAPAQQDDYRVLGSPDAPVEIVIYSDFECTFCRNLALVALPAVIAEFVQSGRVRIRYVFFPLAGLHKNAVAAAKAAHCAGLADKFWSFHDYLFVRQPEWAGDPAPDSLWTDYATNLAIDPQWFARCMAARETHDVVESDLREALAAGATGTPTVIIAGASISGITSYETLRAQILAALDAAARGR